MKEKKHKHLEDLLDEYIDLTDEQADLPTLIEKAQKKFDQHLADDKNSTYKSNDANELFKHHTQMRKFAERQKEISEELAELESSLKEFLTSLQGGKISYDRKDDNDKSKNGYTFSFENDTVKVSK